MTGKNDSHRASSRTRSCALRGVDLFISHQARSRESLPSQATGLLRRAERQATPAGRCCQNRTRGARPGDRLATAPHHRPTRHACAVAPSGIPPILALEVAVPGPSSDSWVLQEVIATMARANQTWGEERIAAELLLKLGVSVSPRTVRRYMRRAVPSRPRSSSQTWRTFVRNHSRETLACDFFVVATATFRVVYVFLVLDIGCGSPILRPPRESTRRHVRRSTSKQLSPLRERVRTSSPRQVQDCRLAVPRSRELMT